MSVTELKFSDGDGDDGDNFSTSNLSVETVNNGWILKADTEDGDTEYTEVFSFSKPELLVDAIKEALGIT